MDYYFSTAEKATELLKEERYEEFESLMDQQEDKQEMVDSISQCLSLVIMEIEAYYLLEPNEDEKFASLNRFVKRFFMYFAKFEGIDLECAMKRWQYSLGRGNDFVLTDLRQVIFIDNPSIFKYIETADESDKLIRSIKCLSLSDRRRLILPAIIRDPNFDLNRYLSTEEFNMDLCWQDPELFQVLMNFYCLEKDARHFFTESKAKRFGVKYFKLACEEFLKTVEVLTNISRDCIRLVIGFL